MVPKILVEKSCTWILSIWINSKLFEAASGRLLSLRTQRLDKRLNRAPDHQVVAWNTAMRCALDPDCSMRIRLYSDLNHHSKHTRNWPKSELQNQICIKIPIHNFLLHPNQNSNSHSNKSFLLLSFDRLCCHSKIKISISTEIRNSREIQGKIRILLLPKSESSAFVVDCCWAITIQGARFARSMLEGLLIKSSIL